MRYQDGVVYGYTLTYHQFGGLRADGTFSIDEGTGTSGLGTMGFSNNAYVVNQFANCELVSDASGNPVEVYYVNQQSATADRYQAAVDQQSAKPEAAWVDFTPDNVAAMLSDTAGGAAPPTSATPEPSACETCCSFQKTHPLRKS